MPRFYLDVRWDGHAEDFAGENFADVAAARREAELSIREIVAEDVKAGRSLNLFRRMAILDENRCDVEEVPFDTIVSVADDLLPQ